MTETNLSLFNEYFNNYKTTSSKGDYLTIDDFLKIVELYGYQPTRFEINDVKAEVGERMDKIYFFVIIARIIKKMHEAEYIEELKACFESLDRNNNNVIEKTELLKAFKMYVSIPPSYDEITNIFNSLDLNNDGHITFEEFVEVITNR